MARPRKPIARERPIVVAAIIERHDGLVLICRTKEGAGSAHWAFPGGLSNVDESPEAGVCRICHARAGVQVDVLVGQPPLTGAYEGRDVEYRYFLCGLALGDGQAIDYEEIRWVAKAQLCEYIFDPPTDEVVRWLAEPGAAAPD